MRRDLPTKLYDGDAGLASEVAIPGASARSRYVSNTTERMTNNDRQQQVGNRSNEVVFEWRG